MAIIDTVCRLVPGVLNNDDSAEIESFHDDLLEYPQYTRPVEFMGKKVPDVLLSGHHKNIEAWRLEQSISRTKEGDRICMRNMKQITRLWRRKREKGKFPD